MALRVPGVKTLPALCPSEVGALWAHCHQSPKCKIYRDTNWGPGAHVILAGGLGCGWGWDGREVVGSGVEVISE